MAVPQQQPYITYAANGIAVTFTIPFKLILESDLSVQLDGTPITSGYVITGLGNDTSSITFSSAPSGSLLLLRDIPLERSVDYQELGDFLSSTVNFDYDRIWMALQGLNSFVFGAVRAPFPESIPAMPSAADRANKLLSFDGYGNPSVYLPAADSSTALRMDLANELDPAKGVALVARSGQVVGSIAELRLLLSGSASRHAFVLGYYQAGDGGGGAYSLDAADTSTADNGGTVIVAADGGRWKMAVTGEVSIKQFGAKADDTTDAGPAINASTSALGYAFVPAGTFRISTNINIGTGHRLYGAGRSATIINSVTPGNSIVVAANAEYWSVKSLRLTRPLGNYGTSSGKNGIHCNGYVQLAHIDDVEVFRHWRGLNLGPTSYSFVSNYLVDNNYDDGIHVEGTATIGAMQWTFFKGISQRNNGCGMKFQTVAGPSGASMGDLVSVSTYGNKIDGIAWIGLSSCPINAIRVRGAFVGEEGRHGIHMDTYGVSTHMLADVFSEICGTLPCGVDSGTPATNQGRGFNITANQQEVILTGCNAIGNSWSGLVSQCPRLTVTGGSYRLNGVAMLAGERNGIQLEAGSGSITGLRANGNKGYGVFLQNDNHQIVGCNLLENVTAAIGAAVSLTVTIDSANRKA
ncbi:hypothetical protein PHLH8_21040 [Pseudomonas sp. Pc102]|uniref:glycosyl hydrolase family 28-related protein n=1 Tax=Pseudomonas sp. Pc102 TaxID=2678261 RepID=UPI001BCFA5F6|nr:glycosyl hydrolase family 28-related protein [Pseudomonas sp. Pc102]BBP82462.1 hypothetical protein PHLH8_21040 [Pseudomonas sp. Pc102]